MATWIAGQSVETIDQSGVKYENIPEGARSFVANHNVAYFSSHGTMLDEPLTFAFWICVCIFSMILYQYLTTKFKP